MMVWLIVNGEGLEIIIITIQFIIYVGQGLCKSKVLHRHACIVFLPNPPIAILELITQLMVCIWRHGGHVGGITQKNVLLVPLSDPAGVGGGHCLPYPERLIANQELFKSRMANFSKTLLLVN